MSDVNPSTGGPPHVPGVSRPEKPFPNLSGVAWLGNGNSGALVTRDGTNCFQCFPGMGDEIGFGDILGGAGHWRLAPTGTNVPDSRQYDSVTRNLMTSWSTSEGCLDGYDFLVSSHSGEAQDVMVRTVTCTAGSIEVKMDCTLVFETEDGSFPVRWRVPKENGSVKAAGSYEGLVVRMSSNKDIDFTENGLTCEVAFTLHEGETAFFALAWGNDRPPASEAEVEAMRVSTIRSAKVWSSGTKLPEHPMKLTIERDLAILKGLVYVPTGASLAAGTTSIPETDEGGEEGENRAYDYTKSWIRDSSMTMMTFLLCGLREEPQRYVKFVMGAFNRWDYDLPVMCDVHGRETLPEKLLRHLKGWWKLGPVRIGNEASEQKQLDRFGQFLHLFYMLHRDDDGPLDQIDWSKVVRLVKRAWKDWEKPDAGLWEFRSGPRRFTSSALYLWLALVCGAHLAAKQGLDHAEEASDWAENAAEIRGWILNNCVDDRGVFVMNPGERELDASCLLIPLLGFLPADDPRVVATVNAIAEELSDKKGLVRRYRTEHVDDGMGGTEEGAFLICSFWLCMAETLIGEKDRAQALFDELSTYANDMGLFAEQIKLGSREQRGNIPQAFSHLARVQAALTLISGEAILAVPSEEVVLREARP